jgi:hypothetical protein
LSAFHKRAQELYNSQEMLTVDEMIVPYKGRYCKIRQFLQNKPIRFGIKIWAMADLESRYVTDVVVYEEKGISIEDEGRDHEVVTNLCCGLEQHWHTLVCDKLFNSPRLFHDLMLDGFWATGILWTGRLGVPKVISQFRGEVGKRGGLVIKMHVHLPDDCHGLAGFYSSSITFH